MKFSETGKKNYIYIIHLKATYFQVGTIKNIYVYSVYYVESQVFAHNVKPGL